MSVFPIVIFVVVGVSIAIGLLTLGRPGSAYDHIGRGSFALDREGGDGDLPGGERVRPPREPSLADEVRQLVVARNERRLRAGEPPLDVEAEVARQLRELGDG